MLLYIKVKGALLINFSADDLGESLKKEVQEG